MATTIHGGDGNDVLAGSTGNDTITGDQGNDMLSGGGGNDSCPAAPATINIITNSAMVRTRSPKTSGTDAIHFGPGITLSNITLSVSGNNVLITVGADTITVQKTTSAADLSGRVAYRLQ